jgi:hypothetical protein
MKEITPVAGSCKSFNNATILIVGRQYKKIPHEGYCIGTRSFQGFLYHSSEGVFPVFMALLINGLLLLV